MAIDFYYKAYPPLIVAGFLYLLEIRTQIYNLQTSDIQSKTASSHDIKYMLFDTIFALSPFMDAVYDMYTNLDKSVRSLTIMIIFAGIEGLCLSFV